MKRFRRTLFVLAVLVIIICAGLLITNYDPTNPTHRRYSSEIVLSTGEAPSDEIGRDGERVLSKDLGLPRNDDEIPVQVVCHTRFKNQQPPAKNTECIYYSDSIENYRVPDFLTDNFFAESKNVRDLTITHERDFKQITAFSIASKALKRPLWIYVRHDTRVDQVYHDLAESTGGRVIYYFATRNYVNPLDAKLIIAIAGALAVMVIVLLWELGARLFTFRFNPRKPKSSVVVPEHKSSRKARHTFDSYDQFMRDAGDNARKTLDD